MNMPSEHYQSGRPPSSKWALTTSWRELRNYPPSSPKSAHAWRAANGLESCHSATPRPLAVSRGLSLICIS